MDNNKLAYFVSKYRSATLEELAEVRRQLGSLADEAEAAFRQVAEERSFTYSAPTSSTDAALATELSPEQREQQTQLSKELLKSALSSRVKVQFSFLLIVPTFHALGPQGMRWGAIPLALALAVVAYVGNQMGRRYARTVCSNAETSIEEKRKQLRTTSWLLWPAIVAATLAAAMILRIVRGS